MSVVCTTWNTTNSETNASAGHSFFSLPTCTIQKDTPSKNEVKAIEQLTQTTPDVAAPFLRAYEAKSCSPSSNISLSEWLQQVQLPKDAIPGCASEASIESCVQKHYANRDINAIFQRALNPQKMIAREKEREWLLYEFSRVCCKECLSSQKWIKRYDALRFPEDVVMVSPTESFVVAFYNTTLLKQIWIKNKSYSIPSFLVGYDTHVMFDKYKLHREWTIVICRLSPRHYHGYHMPFNGVLMGMVFVPGSHWPVQPPLLQSEKWNVLNDNVRLLLFWQTVHFGTVVIGLVGATCVYSMELTHKDERVKKALNIALQEAIHKPGQFLEFLMPNVAFLKRELLGFFRYGSTVVLLTPLTTKNHLSTQIIKHSTQGKETHVWVGQPLLFSWRAFLDPSSLKTTIKKRKEEEPYRFFVRVLPKTENHPRFSRGSKLAYRFFDFEKDEWIPENITMFSIPLADTLEFVIADAKQAVDHPLILTQTEGGGPKSLLYNKLSMNPETKTLTVHSNFTTFNGSERAVYLECANHESMGVRFV